MSKTSRIICRTVTALLALAALPNLYFNALIYLKLDPGFGDYLYGEHFSIADFGPGGIWNGMLNFGEDSGIWEFLPLLRPALIAGIFLALAVLALVAVAVIAAVSNKKLPVLILCGVSAALVVGAYISFGRFANTVVTPEFNVVSLFGDGVLTTLLGSFLQVELLDIRLTGAVSMTLVICLAVAAWTAAFMFTAPKEEARS